LGGAPIGTAQRQSESGFVFSGAQNNARDEVIARERHAVAGPIQVLSSSRSKVAPQPA